MSLTRHNKVIIPLSLFTMEANEDHHILGHLVSPQQRAAIDFVHAMPPQASVLIPYLRHPPLGVPGFSTTMALALCSLPDGGNIVVISPSRREAKKRKKHVADLMEHAPEWLCVQNGPDTLYYKRGHEHMEWTFVSVADSLENLRDGIRLKYVLVDALSSRADYLAMSAVLLLLYAIGVRMIVGIPYNVSTGITARTLVRHVRDEFEDTMFNDVSIWDWSSRRLAPSKMEEDMGTAAN
jgi:hypothetical protein